MDNVDVVSQEAMFLEIFINNNFPRFSTEIEVPLCKLFAQPENKGLKHIWTYGSADLVVRKDDKIVAVFEPGGKHHWEEKQSLNDRRKYKLCQINGVRCCSMMNSVIKNLSKRQLRKLIGATLYGPVGCG
jgi:hypothetical protein